MSSSPTATKPTIVLLQGTFQLPSVYHKFAQLIESHGYPVVQPTYPSLTSQDSPEFTRKTLSNDVAVVETALRKLVEDEGKTVIIAMHSYGGLVGSEAVPADLVLSTRKGRNQTIGGGGGGVAHLFYFAAFVLPLGQSIASAVGDSPDHDHWDGRFRMRDPLATMYDDLPSDEEARYWAERVVAQSGAVKGTAMRRCAYGYVTSTYVVCTQDKAVPAQVQEGFARLAGAKVESIKAGHSAFLSRPEEVVRLLVRAVEGLGL